ncbi:MAG TPA: beta-ketoacyl synthase N-terminal-like domain-containing protein [Polyangiaceae bacterium]|nr:beta-ketoacyl synthase N-terminal-like domain-containing protein [Polyangiaceae bacterium]
MRNVFIAGVGQTPVSKQTTEEVRELGATAVRAAMQSSRLEGPTALYVGNMLSGILSEQQQMGALIAQQVGLGGIEAATIEAACGSGGAALRFGVMAIQSGAHDVVVVCGVERMTHAPKERTTRALATASDWEKEGSRGETFLSLNARMMRAYMETYEVGSSVFAPFAINAHRNANNNPNALFHKEIDEATYATSRQVEGPLRLFDVSPICDGSAAVVLVSEDVARRLRSEGQPLVKVRASAVGTDALALDDRAALLWLAGVERSAKRAFEQAKLKPADIDLFECHDAYTIMSVLSLEAAGFAPEGRGYTLGLEGEIGREGRLPITTMGGLKGRGHPVGATGVYQFAEAFAQLTGTAGKNQVPDAEIAMTQNVGGTGATVITHILERCD